MYYLFKSDVYSFISTTCHNLSEISIIFKRILLIGTQPLETAPTHEDDQDNEDDQNHHQHHNQKPALLPQQPARAPTAIPTQAAQHRLGGMRRRRLAGGNFTESVPATDEDQHSMLLKHMPLVVVPFIEAGGLVRFVPPGSRATTLI